MFSSSNVWTPYLLITVATVSALSLFILSKKRKKFVKVGKINRLFFYPVKSLKAIEVTKGCCTKYGFEVNGFLDRSFMIVDKNGSVISQEKTPSLVLLTPEVKEDYLIIKGPDVQDLKIQIKKSPNSDDKTVTVQLYSDTADAIDCGNEAAIWLQSYLQKDGVRLVQFFSSHYMRKHTRNNPYRIKLCEKHPTTFQNVSAFHVVSKASVEDVNSRVDKKEITTLNFRPNIEVKGCEAFAEDSWKYMKFDSGVEIINLLMKGRCLITTNDPNKGILDMKEPLVSLRKYRMPADKEVLKMTGHKPCVGICCGVVSSGEIEVGNDVFAVVGEKPDMVIKDM